MIVWHVCSAKKLKKYLKAGKITPPVRAWESIEYAQRMSINTGRRIILRLRFPNNAPKLEGHWGAARIMNTAVRISDI